MLDGVYARSETGAALTCVPTPSLRDADRGFVWGMSTRRLEIRKKAIVDRFAVEELQIEVGQQKQA